MDSFHYDIAPENNDIVRYVKKYALLDWEIAEELGLTVDEYRLRLSEPLEMEEKMEIARGTRHVYDLQFEQYQKEKEFYQDHHKYDKYTQWITKHCSLDDRPKYTGQNRNYYEGIIGWD